MPFDPQAAVDVYLSVDIEADGPVPGLFSMLAFGLAVVGRFDGRLLAPADPRAQTFYRELQPIADRFDPESLAVSGLDRGRLVREGEPPEAAMGQALEWVERVAGDDDPVAVGWPLAYDWMFLQWYFVTYCGRSPFGFASGVDMKTLYWRHAQTVIARTGTGDLPEELRASTPHTHHALDDAIGQGEIFLALWSARE